MPLELSFEVTVPSKLARRILLSPIAAHEPTLQSSGLLTSSHSYAPFMYKAWTHPDTLAIISKLAGIELQTMIDIEIGNLNMSVQMPLKKHLKVENQSENDVPATKWHKDSYPFVCVVMMSDASQMVGGETAVRTGSGEIIRVRGPEMVCNAFPCLRSTRC
jgi:hypothetical protein